MNTKPFDEYDKWEAWWDRRWDEMRQDELLSTEDRRLFCAMLDEVIDGPVQLVFS